MHYKNGELSERDRARLALLGGGAAALLAQAGSGYMLQKALESAPRTRSRAYYDKLVRAAGLPGDLPTVRARGVGNAYYAPPHDPAEYDVTDFPERSHAAVKRLGGVVYDPEYNRAGVLAHELGHASIEHGPWYSPSRFNQRWLRPAGDLANSLAAPAAGVFVGLNTGKPLYGAGVGLGAGLLSGLPTLVNEWQATSRGRRFMDAVGEMPARTRGLNDRALNRAVLTYLTGAAVPALAGGAIAGMLGRSPGAK